MCVCVMTLLACVVCVLSCFVSCRCPTNGLVLFVGTILTDDGKEKKVRGSPLQAATGLPAWFQVCVCARGGEGGRQFCPHNPSGAWTPSWPIR